MKTLVIKEVSLRPREILEIRQCDTSNKQAFCVRAYFAPEAPPNIDVRPITRYEKWFTNLDLAELHYNWAVENFDSILMGLRG